MKTNIWTQLIDLISPRPCVMCGRRLDADEEFTCQTCSNELPRTNFHLKAEENIMAQLFWGLLPLERATAWFYFASHTKTSNIIYDLKYHNQPEIGIAMGQAMTREIAESGFFDGIDAIVPIPLARQRQQERGYNQSTMIARGINKETGIPVVEDAVIRLHFQQSQTQLDRWERLKNVEQQFKAANAAQLTNKHVLLVDDVTTTGATIIACGSALRQAPGIRFSVLTLGFTHS